MSAQVLDVGKFSESNGEQTYWKPGIFEKLAERYTNADLKISLYVCVYIKTIPWKFCNFNPKNSWVIWPWSLQIS